MKQNITYKAVALRGSWGQGEAADVTRGTHTRGHDILVELSGLLLGEPVQQKGIVKKAQQIDWGMIITLLA